MLRRKAETRATEEKPAAPRTEEIERVDRNLRASFRYLADFAREVNAAMPVVGHRYRMVYMGDLPELTLTDAFADFRMRRMDDREFHDYVSLSCRLRPSHKPTVELSGQDLEQFERELAALQLECERRESRNIFGRVSRVAFTLSAIPCYVRIRANYDSFDFWVELRNVGGLGRARRSFSLEAYTEDLIDELGQYLLGLDRSFASRLE